MVQVSLADVVKQMASETESSTLGWDVVVNYAEKEINNLLKDSYHNDPKGHLKELKLQVIGYDENLDPFTVDFTFQLGPPLITFVGSGIKPSCNLLIPVDGGESKTSTKTEPIPAGAYQFELSNLEMASMSGSAEGDTGLTSSDKPFVFPSQSSGSAIVTVDLRASKQLVGKLFKVEGATESSRQVDARKANLEGKLYDCFTDDTTASSIRYQLASVDPAQPPAGYVTLRPKSFRFAAYHSQEHSTTILSLFIQTSDTQSGTQADLQLKWLSRWVNGYGVPPIPNSHTASIIFNSTMMHNTVVVPALKTSNVDTSTPTFFKGKGLQYKLLTHRKVEQGEEGDKLHHWKGPFSVDLDKDNNQLYVTIGQNEDYNSPAQCVMAWNFRYTFDWSYKQHTGHQSYTWSGNCTVTNNLKKSRGFSGTLTDDRLEMNLNIATSDWDKATYTSNNTDSLGQWLSGLGVQSDDWFARSFPTMTSFDVNLGNLYFFLTTNLLMPGKKVISVDASSSGGLRIPHDYYIVGNIASK